MQQDGLYLLCTEHNQQIISLDQQKEGKLKMNCITCLTKQQIPISQFPKYLESLMNNKQSRLINSQKQSQTRLNEIKKKFIMISETFSQSMTMLIKKIDEQLNQMNLQIYQQMEFQPINQTQLIEQTQLLMQEQEETQDIFLESDNQFKQKTFNDLIEIVNQLKLDIEKQLKNRDNQKQQFKLVIEKKDIYSCNSVTMDKDERLLVNSKINDIQIWTLNENRTLTLQQTLKAHTSPISCLYFSKKSNWFISGGADKQIIIWKETSIGQWKRDAGLEGHNYMIRNLALNNLEDELISCSADKINIWKETTQWVWFQTISLHDNPFFFFSLNPDSSQIVTCGQNGLIIWLKGKNDLWEKINDIQNPAGDQYRRVCFIARDELLATTKNIGQLVYLSLQNGESNQIKFQMQLNELEEQDLYLFPIAYNQDEKLALCRHGRNHIYVLAKQNNDSFFVQQVLDGNYWGRYLSKQGGFIILANNRTNTLQVWFKE